ncbi:MAG: BrxA/BrxB family bacilliredoxin, partial [Bacteroidota bacterium]|nr:BrxA/BrxB family bacilliredoxin [Bacteroidota bacterium]
MKQELTTYGFDELVSEEEVDKAVNEEGTTLV